MTDFGQKLELILKILSLSRAGLASAIGVNKSVTGRWVSGKVHPSDHNLARISQFIAHKIPQFSMLDWDRDYDDFAAFIGASRDPVAGTSKTIWPLLPPKLATLATYTAETRSAAYEGFWRSTRPSSDVPGQFLHDISMVRRDKDGFLSFSSGIEGFYYEGNAVMINQQLFYFAADDASEAITMGIMNGVPRGRAEVIDGVLVTTLRDAWASPAASGIYMERIGDLTDNPEADEARFHELVNSQIMLSPPDSVPKQVTEALHEAANAPGMLRMLYNQSLARGPVIDPA